MRVIRSYPADDVGPFLQQLIQQLVRDEDGAVRQLLIDMARKDMHFCHLLLWGLRTETAPPQKVAKVGLRNRRFWVFVQDTHVRFE